MKIESARMVKCVQINNQLCNILIKEEFPVWYGGRGKNNISSSISSESVSSSETYIEETVFMVMNGEEENRLWRGEEYHSKREEEGEEIVEEDEQYPHETNLLYVGSS